MEESYQQGELEGEWTHWYSNGQIREQGRYVHGLREGQWHFFDREGRTMLRIRVPRRVRGPSTEGSRHARRGLAVKLLDALRAGRFLNIRRRRDLRIGPLRRAPGES